MANNRAIAFSSDVTRRVFKVDDMASLRDVVNGDNGVGHYSARARRS